MSFTYSASPVHCGRPSSFGTPKFRGHKSCVQLCFHLKNRAFLEMHTIQKRPKMTHFRVDACRVNNMLKNLRTLVNGRCVCKKHFISNTHNDCAHYICKS
jgi:hypothetical protein